MMRGERVGLCEKAQLEARNEKARRDNRALSWEGREKESLCA